MMKRATRSRKEWFNIVVILISIAVPAIFIVGAALNPVDIGY
ncbi:hypothetical protein [Williamsia sp.]|nr:hypothetical protein [Williamsia sp.]